MNNVVVYKNIHFFIQPSKLQRPPPPVPDGSTSPPTPGNTLDNRTRSEDAPTDDVRSDGAESLSVIIFGTDSASRLNMRRHLPKTYQYLTETLGAVELLGYNKVGDNTFPNLIPVLGGLSATELVNHSCVPKKEKFDHCRWIWKDFKKNGYVTAFLEV